ncbi:MAG: ABC transporter substrate-binding protein [Planctomycetota bacterium]
MAGARDVLLVGIDDTDVVGSRGTGWRARTLAQRLRDAGWVTLGVTRHQLLVDPRIPYTSHNSSACIAVAATRREGERIWRQAEEFPRRSSETGSDPGLCVASQSEATETVRAFGRRAQREVLAQADAQNAIRGTSVLLKGLAGTSDGLIGALAAVGLRAGGDDGRFLELGAIRELTGVAPVSEILEAGVDEVRGQDGKALDLDARVETMNWVRPSLVLGRAVLVVERSTRGDRIWKPVGRHEPKKRGGAGDGR